MDISNTLKERGARYGEFEEHAAIAQGIQDVMRAQAGWANLAADQRQALTVIADKIARMLNGDPSYIDNWHDIVGYATLVEKRMERDAMPKAMNDNVSGVPNYKTVYCTRSGDLKRQLCGECMPYGKCCGI